MTDIPAEILAEAKSLLQEQLANHPDEGISLINKIIELSDDHPSVQRVALLILTNRDRR